MGSAFDDFCSFSWIFAVGPILHPQAGAGVLHWCGPASCDWGGSITRDRFWDLRLALFWGLLKAVADANSKNYLSLVLKFGHTRRKPNVALYICAARIWFFAIVDSIINLQLLGWTLGTNIGNLISLLRGRKFSKGFESMGGQEIQRKEAQRGCNKKQRRLKGDAKKIQALATKKKKIQRRTKGQRLEDPQTGPVLNLQTGRAWWGLLSSTFAIQLLKRKLALFGTDEHYCIVYQQGNKAFGAFALRVNFLRLR